MKKKLIQIVTKRHTFAGVNIGVKVLLICLLLAPIFVVTLSSMLVQNSIKGVFEMATIDFTPGVLQAQIVVDQPAWFTNHSATVASRVAMESPRGYAPYAVFFQGWQSAPRNEIVEYSWNFGDNNSYFNSSDKSGNPNDLTGFNSAHVFEEPGVYNVTLTVKNRLGQTAQTSKTVTVLDREDYVDPVTSVSSKTYYVAPEGNDSYSGLCMVKSENDNCGPWKTAQKAFSKLQTAKFYKPYDSVLFKRDGSYAFNKAYSAKVEIDRLLFSTYGEGAKPIIQYETTTTAPGGTLVSMSKGSGGVAFVDLSFRFKSLSSQAQLGGVLQGVGFSANLLALRVDAQDLQSQFFTFGKPSGNPAEAEAVNTGVFIFDSKFSVSDAQYNQTALNNNKNERGVFDATFIWGYMGNMGMVGNTFDHSYNHLTYLSHLNKAVIVNNTFSRPAYGRDALRIDGQLVNGNGTNNVYIADNKLMGWKDLALNGGDSGGQVHDGKGAYNFQLINLGPNRREYDQLISYVVFERNILTNFEWAMKIADAENIIVRNNLFISPNQEANIAGVIVIGDRGWEWRPSQNITIVGNTFAIQSPAPVCKSPSAIFFINPFLSSPNNPASNTPYTLGLQHQNINIFNNLIYRPASSSQNMVIFNYNPPANLLSELHLDGNFYHNPGMNTNRMFGYQNWSGSTCLSITNIALDSWQNTYGFDINSQFATNTDFTSRLFNSSPTFYSNAVGTPTLANNLNQANTYKEMFKLKDDEFNPAIDGGVNANNYLDYDFNGIQRPDGSWSTGSGFDVGAFEIFRRPNVPPIANFNFSPNTGIAPLSVSFDASGSSDSDGTISTYSWNFGDGASATGVNTNHIYTAPGNYEITLSVVDNSRAIATRTLALIVEAPDTQPPTTSVNPIGGGYANAQNIQFTTDELAGIYACIGINCTPSFIATSTAQLTISNSNTLKFYSKDVVGNREQIKEEVYVISPCVSDWSCPAWSECINGTQSRVCNDLRSCTTETRRGEVQNCGSESNGNGLKGSYFSNHTLSGNPVLVRTDSQINFAWQSSAPATNVPKDRFSVRWEGEVQADTSGSYTFFTETDDGVRLYIDGRLVINHWKGQRKTTWSATLDLTAGRHQIVMEYFEDRTNAIAKLLWSGPSISKQIIPRINLYSAN
ncbi:MAG: PKD domain-containing protein [Candidatus Buchananbacteria bacterium]